ncbi:MAG TPA: hypothetical protein DDW76_26655 [Cyanobacteria bacterium UBA11369]|nr:hypothetical protein [Cyanobacteria bacterium UBA11371]HBE33065.1 hypothetical protein [Cyanobacteria bacterium UBA11368]HBE52252.1 hypothetical protein [Cyanobacteria bacterium UBA11369]
MLVNVRYLDGGGFIYIVGYIYSLLVKPAPTLNLVCVNYCRRGGFIYIVGYIYSLLVKPAPTLIR